MKVYLIKINGNILPAVFKDMKVATRKAKAIARQFKILGVYKEGPTYEECEIVTK
jgi:hypothetical protein